MSSENIKTLSYKLEPDFSTADRKCNDSWFSYDHQAMLNHTVSIPSMMTQSCIMLYDRALLPSRILMSDEIIKMIWGKYQIVFT